MSVDVLIITIKLNYGIKQIKGTTQGPFVIIVRANCWEIYQVVFYCQFIFIGQNNDSPALLNFLLTTSTELI